MISARPLLVIVAMALFACGNPEGKDKTGNGGTTPDGGNTSTQGPVDEGPLQYTPLVQWDQYSFEGYPVRSHIPENPQGVVAVFHGAGGDVGFVSKLEPVAFLNELILQDIGFFATNAEAQNGIFAESDNPRVGRLYEEIIATTNLEAGDALFTSGFSGGGKMAGMFAEYADDEGWPIKAINPANNSCWVCPEIPTFWVLTELDVDPQAQAQSTYDSMKDRGVPVKLKTIVGQPIDETSFLKHPSMNEQKALAVYEDLLAKNGIDADGHRIVPDDEAEEWCAWYNNNGGVSGSAQRAEELRVFWALHRFNAYHARDVRDFFLKHMD